MACLAGFRLDAFSETGLPVNKILGNLGEEVFSETCCRHRKFSETKVR